MWNLIRFINPLTKLGTGKYSIFPALIANILLSIFSEIIAYSILKNPLAVGNYIIILNIILIVYFSLRDGITGGFISSFITILYYASIIYTRHYTGFILSSGIITTIILGIIYIILSTVIGGLRQAMDILIERETNEKIRLQMILEQLPVGVIVTNSSGSIEQTNKQLEKILGMKLPKGLQAGKNNILDAYQETKTVEAHHSLWVQVLSQKKSILGKQFIIKRPNGKQVAVKVNASTIVNKAGKAIAAASIITDITQQKELEKRKDDFINMASHELKTPLTSMKLYLDSLRLLFTKTKNEKAASTLDNIQKQTSKLQELVNELLDVSRLQTGKLNLKKEIFPLKELVIDTIKDLQGSAKNQKIIFKINKSIFVRADKFRIYQVLTNLITNAIKYSSAGKTIYVYLTKEKNKAIVEVRDSGIGIAKEEQKKIFDRLYQVAGSTEKTFPGLGMGLYISKEIVKKHMGNIWVKSIKGKGSSFYFSLPI